MDQEQIFTTAKFKTHIRVNRIQQTIPVEHRII